MTETPLRTLRDIAVELAIPESTARYYRDIFASHIPTVGTGRRRRYPAEGVAVLRRIAEGYAAGKSRSHIEFELTGGVPPTEPRPVPAHRLDLEDLLATVLDGERERREVMWQMAREIVRLGEAIERQQEVLAAVAEHVTVAAHRALPPASASAAGGPMTGDAGADPAQAVPGPSGFALELEALRAELASERALVERLRESKLVIERRAAAAEARLDERVGRDVERSSVLRRLLSRRPEEDGGG